MLTNKVEKKEYDDLYLIKNNELSTRNNYIKLVCFDDAIKPQENDDLRPQK